MIGLVPRRLFCATLLLGALAVPSFGSSIDAQDDTVSTDQDIAIDVTVLANDSGDGIHVTSVSQPDNGSATVNPDDSIRYQPQPGYIGTDTFGYTITDADFASSTATVTVEVALGSQPVVIVSIDVTPQLVAPSDSIHVSVIVDSLRPLDGVEMNDQGLIDQGFGVWSGDIIANTAPGTHIISVKAIDDQGFTAQDSSAYTTAPIVSANNRSLYQDLMPIAQNSFLFTVCGRVTVEEPGVSFLIDDGTGKPVWISAAGNTLATGDVAAARGQLNVISDPAHALLFSASPQVVKLD